jgi:enamine deaminase RidA (YjgF/YER057c/UK114 family)
MLRNARQWMPDHKPIWTCLGVAALAQEGMRVEIEVVAHDPK